MGHGSNLSGWLDIFPWPALEGLGPPWLAGFAQYPEEPEGACVPAFVTGRTVRVGEIG